MKKQGNGEEMVIATKFTICFHAKHSNKEILINTTCNGATVPSSFAASEFDEAPDQLYWGDNKTNDCYYGESCVTTKQELRFLYEQETLSKRRTYICETVTRLLCQGRKMYKKYKNIKIKT